MSEINLSELSKSKPSVVLTGASGLVGSAIVDALIKAGYHVFALSRRPTHKTGCTWIKYDQRAFSELELPLPCQALIHCAYDFEPSRWPEIKAINVDQSIKLWKDAEKRGISTRIFVSSMSAFDGCKSLYGRAKLQVEQYVLGQGDLVVRPGLVFSDRMETGILSALAKIAKKSRVVPMVGTGMYMQYLIHRDDLADLMVRLISNPTEVRRPGLVVAGNPSGKTIKDLVLSLAPRNADDTAARLIFIPVPWWLIFSVLKLFESLGVRAGFRSDSLIGLVFGDPRPHFDSKFRFRDFSGAQKLDRV